MRRSYSDLGIPRSIESQVQLYANAGSMAVPCTAVQKSLKNMTDPHVSIDLEAENFYEIYSTEVAEKTLVFLLFILTAAAGQNSSDLYSKFSCMSPVRIALYFRNFA